MQKLAFTVREACQITGLARTTIYKLFSKGSLTPRKAGKRTLILASELETFVKSLPAGGPAHGE
jgi:excisionase family DNA binding protein